MFGHDALPTTQDPSWRLLAEFFLLTKPGSEAQSVEPITQVVQELGLPPDQVQRIRKTVTEALRKATKGGNQDQHDLLVTVRIWVSAADIADPSPSNAEAQQADQGAGCGWGFFLVQKPADDPHPRGHLRQTSAGESHYLIELFLYQEKPSPRKNR